VKALGEFARPVLSVTDRRARRTLTKGWVSSSFGENDYKKGLNAWQGAKNLYLVGMLN